MLLPRRAREQMRVDSARWVAARRAGQTVAQVAAAAGASAATVSRATSAHGPFPVLHRVSEQERDDWVAARRGRSTPTQIAAQAPVRVSAWAVAQATAPLGPFPTPPAPPAQPRWPPQDAARWAEMRRRRIPITRIVDDENNTNNARDQESDDGQSHSPSAGTGPTGGSAGGCAARSVLHSPRRPVG
ncbi:hypothetical protein V3N99_22300 (plasmid) [Dermatophilaceae bacterium Soc4.6]